MTRSENGSSVRIYPRSLRQSGNLVCNNRKEVNRPETKPAPRSQQALTECQKHLPEDPGTDSPECNLPGLGNVLPNLGRLSTVKQASLNLNPGKQYFT
jgi:hypothetical protein